jgi:hypothetical protein
MSTAVGVVVISLDCNIKISDSNPLWAINCPMNKLDE